MNIIEFDKCGYPEIWKGKGYHIHEFGFLKSHIRKIEIIEVEEEWKNLH